MDDLHQELDPRAQAPETPEQTEPAEDTLTAEKAPEQTGDVLIPAGEREDAPEEEAEEEPDEIFFTSDFVMDTDDFNETAEYAYLRVANNSLILAGLIVVFFLSCLLAGNRDYLLVLPIVALVIAVTQVRRYGNTDKEISQSHANIVYLVQSETLHYHIEFGEYIHTTNNGRKTKKRDLNEVTAICETAKYWLLCLEEQLYIAVKKDSITGENPAEFLSYLQHYCHEMKKKKITKVTGKKKQAAYGVICCVVLAVISLIIGFLLGYVL